MTISQPVGASTFAQRFEFARARQRMLGTWQEDQTLADLIGVSGGQISDYKAREESPPGHRTLKLARVMGVDPGWLAFGSESAAPIPEGFETWLANRQQKLAAFVPPPAAEVKRRRQPPGLAPTKSGAPLSPMLRQPRVPGEEKPETTKKRRGA